MNKIFLIILFIITSTFADATYNKNKKANKLYEQGKYAEALSLYEEAALEDPNEKKLSMNKGSALYRLEDLSGAEESYKNSLSIQDQKARADLLYNMGNVYHTQGDQLAPTGNPQAMEKYKAARDNYIKSLDLRPHDKDAKWNLQLTQLKIKELEKQQQQQQQQDNKGQNKQDQDKQNQNQQQDKKDQQQQDKKDQQKKDQQQQKTEDQQQEQKPQPKPQNSEEDMKKEEAMRLLRQYADDDKELNKPQKKMRALMEKKPEKDW